MQLRFLSLLSFGDTRVRSLISSTVPASFFGIVLDLAGVGNTWRAAHWLWQMPAIVGGILEWMAVGVWLIVVLIFSAKWLWHRMEAKTEITHPVLCCYVGLVGV